MVVLTVICVNINIFVSLTRDWTLGSSEPRHLICLRMCDKVSFSSSVPMQTFMNMLKLWGHYTNNVSKFAVFAVVDMTGV